MKGDQDDVGLVQTLVSFLLSPFSRRAAPRGAVAQLGERLVCNQEVVGSIPIRSIVQPDALPSLAMCRAFFVSTEVTYFLTYFSTATATSRTFRSSLITASSELLAGC